VIFFVYVLTTNNFSGKSSRLIWNSQLNQYFSRFFYCVAVVKSRF